MERQGRWDAHEGNGQPRWRRRLLSILRSQETSPVIVNGFRIPRPDVAFGQLAPVNQGIEERTLTKAEQEAVDAVAGALRVWDDAWKEVPKLHSEHLKAAKDSPAQNGH